MKRLHRRFRHGIALVAVLTVVALMALAASTAARAASSSSIGTTIPGSTIESLVKRMGTTLVVSLASAMNPPKFSQIDSTLGCGVLFPARTTHSGDDRRHCGRYP